MVIWKSTWAVAVSAVVPVWKFDSPLATSGNSNAAPASRYWPTTEVRMMLDIGCIETAD